MRIHVRPAAEADVDFLVAANRALARESEGKELDESTVRAGVRAVFSRAGLASYWIAEVGDRPAGCLMLTSEWSDWRDGVFWWIQSVWVDPVLRGKGVFSALYEHVRLHALEEPNVCGLRLYVERANDRAQSVYQKLGMVETPYKLLEEEFVHGRR